MTIDGKSFIRITQSAEFYQIEKVGVKNGLLYSTALFSVKNRVFQTNPSSDLKFAPTLEELTDKLLNFSTLENLGFQMGVFSELC